MTKGLALTIGLNSVNPDHYAGWSGDLVACEADAQDMAKIAESKGFQVKTLLTKEATRDRVIDEISRAAGALGPGDIFMISYSGHGGQLPDLNSDEIDYQDETWCLYDGEFVDDELYGFWSRFAPGVRILVFSDSCHSGTVVKVAYYRSRSMNTSPLSAGSQPVRYRAMMPDVALAVYRKNKEFYDKILKNSELNEHEDAVKASILLFGGCQDNQLSSDGVANGLFTSQLLMVWAEGAFVGNYKQFHKKIISRMPPDQTPNYYLVGAANKEFEQQSPFTI